MAQYTISGVWKDDYGTITHYAIHEANFEKQLVQSPAKKYSKAAAIKLLENSQNSARTMLWNYSAESWKLGVSVNVVGTGASKYLRTTQDKTVRDNLAHLIDYSFATDDLT